MDAQAPKPKFKLKISRPKKLHTNSSMAAKIKVRRHVLKELGNPNPRILDVFCAKGEMWKAAYGATPNYIGLDLEQFKDERTTVVCDNTRFLRQENLDQFDIFDLDAFGSPFEHLRIISERFNWGDKQSIGIVLTDGTGFNSKMNGLPKAFLKWIGVSEHAQAMVQYKERDSFILMGIMKSAELLKATPRDIKSCFRNGSGHALMRYIGYVLDRD